jgi:hypothetical protein
MPSSFTQADSLELYCFRFISVRHRPTPYFTGQHRKLSMFQRLGRTPGPPGLRIPPVAHSTSPPDQSFFYALDTPASSTQSSLGNLLPDSALVRLVSRNSQNQLEELPDYLSKSPAPAQNPSISPDSFGQATPEIKSPPRVMRRSLVRKIPHILPFLPIQSPPDSPILIEPKESSPSGNFTFHLHTPEPSMARRCISHPYTRSLVDPSTSLGFPRSPSQEFHSCDEESPGQGPSYNSPVFSSTSPINNLLEEVSSNAKSPSLLVNPGGGSPFFASASGSRSLTVPRPASASYTEDSLGEQSPNIFTSRSTIAVTSAKLVPFSASARASVVSESPSYTSERAYQGGTSPTVPYELEEYYDYVEPESSLQGRTESTLIRNGPGQAISSSDIVPYVGESNLEPPDSGAETKPSFCVSGPLFSIPEEDGPAESSSSRSRSDPSSGSNGSVMVTAAGSLPSLPSTSYEEFAVSFATSGSFPVLNHPTPGASGVRSRPTHMGTGTLPIVSTPAQTTLRGTGTPGSPPNVGTLRYGTRESYTGSGDLNDGTEMSGACMNGLYEELEEWGCEWILQNQQQSSPSTARA